MSQTEIFDLLKRRRYVSHETMYFWLYQLRPESERPSFYTVHALIWKLRRKLPEGMKIVNVNGAGYRLERA